MNIQIPPRPKAILGADGLERRHFTVDDVLAMIDAGIIDPDEKFELIKGEIFPMAAGRNPHESVKLRLNRRLAGNLPEGWILGVETSLYLSDDTFVEPDLSIIPEAMETHQVYATDCALIIEVADTSLRKDTKIKAPLYSEHSVPEYWLIDVNKRQLTVRLGPTGDDWTETRIFPETSMVAPKAFPDLAVNLVEVFSGLS